MTRFLRNKRAGPAYVQDMRQDVLHAFRQFRRNPGFVLIAMLSLGLGIGANSAIFSVADALLLRPLPVADPGRLMNVSAATPSNPYESHSFPQYRDLREAARSFDGLLAYQFRSYGVASDARSVPQIRFGFAVSGNFFEVLGVKPLLGRTFRPGEGETPGKDPVAVLSHSFWQDHLGGDAGVVGRSIRINGLEMTVIGVTPPGFRGLDSFFTPALFVPVSMIQAIEGGSKNLLEERKEAWLQVKGRLRPGVTQKEAQSELETIAANLSRAYPETNSDRTLAVVTELESRVRQSPPDAVLVVALSVLAALVLLIACANVANLQLARARARTREIAVRLAIGVGRARLVRQLFTESLLLSLLGAAVGLGFGWLGIRFLQTFEIPTDLPIGLLFQLDERVLLVSLGAAVLSALVCGLAPAMQASRTELVSALKDGDGAQRRSRMVGRHVLVAGQVALSLVLLVAAGMLLDGFRKSLVLDPGFQIDHRLVADFDPSVVRYTPEKSREFYRNLVDRVRELPGVRRATLGRAIPLSPNAHVEQVIPEGYAFPKDRTFETVFANVVDGQYFDTLGIAMAAGRGIGEQDRKDGNPVAVVNQAFADRYWPGQNAVGRRLRLGGATGPWFEVVGVAKTGRYLYLAEPATPFLYTAYDQRPRMSMSLVVESAGDPAALGAPVREIVRTLDANLPVFNLRTLAGFYEKRAIASNRIVLQLVSALGLIGLTLALLGLYGLMTYSVSRRTKEIGTRMAIGATSGNVLRMVLRQGLLLAGVGMAFGGVLSYFTAKAVAIGLAGLGSPSALTFVAVPVALLAVSLLACYVPARRASRVDPLRALRWE
ncbi:MAG TPA: hypothetical protein DEH78_16505 [Solibacterales bacterium]|nr:hypothetical protein [Bryobacterales bacterium]